MKNLVYLPLCIYMTTATASVNTLPEDIYNYTYCKIDNFLYIVPLSEKAIIKNRDNHCEGYYKSVSDALGPVCNDAIAWSLKHDTIKDGVNKYLQKWPQSYSLDPKFGIKVECKEK